MSTSSKMFFRPEWTCGRYNSEKKAALFYNLVEGVSYYFEDDSADVIGQVLEVGRNGLINTALISKETGIAYDSILIFFEQLEKLKLLVKDCPTRSGIAEYRKRYSDFLSQQVSTKHEETIDKLPFEISTSEMEYTERVGGVTSVMFELTYNCSEKCIHCYNPGATRNDTEVSGRGNREELTIDEYRRIIDQLYEQGLFKVCLSGGDPFSKPIVWDIIEYLYKKDIAFDVFTNGQRIVNDVERLASYYPRLVGVSIYSGIAAEHDYITRIPGSWEKSMTVVKELSALSVPMNLKCCVMKPNVKHYWMVSDIARQYGAEAQFEINITDSVEGDICARNLRLSPLEMEIILRDDNIKLYVGKEAPNFGGYPKDLNNPGCGAGQNTFCITPEGNFIPCCAFHLSFGNLRNNSVLEILNSSVLKEYRSQTLLQYEECGRHDYCAYCNLCPGINFGEHGTMKKASENCCYTARIRCSLANRMKQGYDPLNGKDFKERLAELPDYAPKKLSRIINVYH